MGIFDRVSKQTDDQLPSGMQETQIQQNQKLSARVTSDTADMIDDELPSVNRRRTGASFGGKLGYAALIGGGLMMLYFINTENQQKVEAPKQMEIVNRLPPLEIPAPPPPSPPPPLPVPEVKVPPVEQPIAVKQTQPAVNKPQGPTWLDRRMGGNLVLQTGGTTTAPAVAASGGNVSNTVTAGADTPTSLALMLKSTVSPGVSANILPDRNYLITKGTSLDCALETALDSTVPGITTCRLTRDIYSDNGHVLLLERGSQLVGEYQGGITAGQARIFVLWSRVKTPNGVIVNLDSPGADALGRSGHAGWVDRHFMERFGAAVLMSLVKDALVIARNKNQTQFQIGGGGTDQLAVEILRETARIPPTLYINQGDHIQIMVARDLDFSSVYGLQLKE